jgi:hypothetical protein
MKGVFLMKLNDVDDPMSLVDELGISLRTLTDISTMPYMFRSSIES